MAKRKTKKSRTPQAPPPPDRTAKGADRYELYGLSVQDAGHEVDFFERVYRDRHGKAATPRVLREDFCGTFAVCCEWVRQDESREAIGVDLDPEPLGWGIANHMDTLEAGQHERITLLQQDVRRVSKPKADILAAQNFSFFIFPTRDELRLYLRKALQNLAPGGVMVLDMMGGPDCWKEGQEDVRKIGKGKRRFKYVWETEKVDPVSHHCRMHIGFRFPDGTAMERCFTYDWRLWTLPEVRELLAEAGFERSVVYWESEDKDGDGSGLYEPLKDATPVRMDPAWVGYIVAYAGGSPS